MTLQFALNRLFVVTTNLGSVFEKVSNLFNVGRCGVREWSVNFSSLSSTHKCWTKTLTCKLNFKFTIKVYKTCEMSPAPPPSLLTLWRCLVPPSGCVHWLSPVALFCNIVRPCFSSALLFDRTLTLCLLLSPLCSMAMGVLQNAQVLINVHKFNKSQRHLLV